MTSLFLRVMGFIVVAYWFSKIEIVFRKKIAMVLTFLGQIILWGSIHSTLTNGYNAGLVSVTVPSVIFCWFFAIIFSKIKRIGRYKSVERRNFSSSAQKETRDKQHSRCAVCKCDLSSKIIQYDHIDSDRSNNDPANCQALCSNCHSKKRVHNNPLLTVI
jgi:hypothetical protein